MVRNNSHRALIQQEVPACSGRGVYGNACTDFYPRPLRLGEDRDRPRWPKGFWHGMRRLLEGRFRTWPIRFRSSGRVFVRLDSIVWELAFHRFAVKGMFGEAPDGFFDVVARSGFEGCRILESLSGEVRVSLIFAEHDFE